MAEKDGSMAKELALIWTAMYSSIVVTDDVHSLIQEDKEVTVEQLIPQHQKESKRSWIEKFGDIAFNGESLHKIATAVAQNAIGRIGMNKYRFLKKKYAQFGGADAFVLWLSFRVRELLLLLSFISYGIDFSHEILEDLDLVLLVLHTHTNYNAGDSCFLFPQYFEEFSSGHNIKSLFMKFNLRDFENALTWIISPEFLETLLAERSYDRDFLERYGFMKSTPLTGNLIPRVLYTSLSDRLLGVVGYAPKIFKMYKKRVEEYMEICFDEEKNYENNRDESQTESDGQAESEPPKKLSAKKKRKRPVSNSSLSEQEVTSKRPKKKMKAVSSSSSSKKSKKRKTVEASKSLGKKKPKKVLRKLSALPEAEVASSKKHDSELHAFWKQKIRHLGQRTAIQTYGKSWQDSELLKSEFKKNSLDTQIAKALQGKLEYDEEDIEGEDLVREESDDDFIEEDLEGSDIEPEIQRIPPPAFLASGGAAVLHQLNLLNKRVGELWIMLKHVNPDILQSVREENKIHFGLRISVLDEMIERNQNGDSVFSEETASTWLNMLSTSTQALGSEIEAACQRARDELEANEDPVVAHVHALMPRRVFQEIEEDPKPELAKEGEIEQPQELEVPVPVVPSQPQPEPSSQVAIPESKNDSGEALSMQVVVPEQDIA